MKEHRRRLPRRSIGDFGKDAFLLTVFADDAAKLELKVQTCEAFARFVSQFLNRVHLEVPGRRQVT